MFEVKVTVEIPALDRLAGALMARAKETSTAQQPAPAPVAPAVPTTAPVQQPAPAAPVVQTAVPVQAPAAVHTAPVQAQPAPIQPPMPQVPVAAPTAYTIEQLMNAAAALAAGGRRPDLLALLGKYGVQALTQLSPDQYGAFATDLRGLGAKI